MDGMWGALVLGNRLRRGKEVAPDAASSWLGQDCKPTLTATAPAAPAAPPAVPQLRRTLA
jgi:hypothetical protein